MKFEYRRRTKKAIQNVRRGRRREQNTNSSQLNLEM
jgi:hypothetical protein